MRRMLCISALMIYGCSQSGNTDEWAALTEAKDKWRAQALHTYQYTLTVSCFCSHSANEAGAGTFVVSIKDDVVDSAADKDSGEPLTAEQAASLPTVDGLFAAIEDAYAADADRTEVTYDPARGFPSHVLIDPILGAADDETEYRATDLEAP